MSYTVTAAHTPNRSPRQASPIYLVVHQTIGGYDPSVAWLENPAAQASADEVISRDGTRVTNLNPMRDRMRTWEVGNANDLCVGFELEDLDVDIDDIPPECYFTLAARLKVKQAAIKAVYGNTIPLVHSTEKGVSGIVSHHQVAQWYGGSDHTDGDVDWDQLARALNPIRTDVKAAWEWSRWRLNIVEYAGRGYPRQSTRPKVPPRIPLAWWKYVAWYTSHVVRPAKKES